MQVVKNLRIKRQVRLQAQSAHADRLQSNTEYIPTSTDSKVMERTKGTPGAGEHRQLVHLLIYRTCWAIAYTLKTTVQSEMHATFRNQGHTVDITASVSSIQIGATHQEAICFSSGA